MRAVIQRCGYASVNVEGKIFGKNEKGKNIFTIRINEADIEKATELVNGIDSVKIRKKKENER